MTLHQQLDATSQCWDSIPITAHIRSHLSFVRCPIIHIKKNIDGTVSHPAIVHQVNWFRHWPSSDQYLLIKHLWGINLTNKSNNLTETFTSEAIKMLHFMYKNTKLYSLHGFLKYC